MKKTIIEPGTVHKPPISYSHAIVVEGGKMIFVSGQCSLDEKGEIVGPGDMRAQTRQCLENLKMVLESCGATMRDVVKTTVFAIDAPYFRNNCADIRAQYFQDHFPASTLVEVRCLARKEYLVEIEAIAVIP